MVIQTINPNTNQAVETAMAQATVDFGGWKKTAHAQPGSRGRQMAGGYRQPRQDADYQFRPTHYLMEKGLRAHLIRLSVLLLYAVSAVGQQHPPNTPRQEKATTPMPAMHRGQVGMSGMDGMSGMEAMGMTPPSIMVGQGGKWVIGYQFSMSEFKGNLAGTTRVSATDILKTFAAAPTKMQMQMQMLMGMYAPTARLTLGVAVPYSRMTMDQITADGMTFSERTSGLGDIQFQALYSLHVGHTEKDLHHRFLLNVSLGLPTGSINRTMDGMMRMSYPMQQGSGTVSFTPGITYLGQALPWGWGAEFLPTMRVGKNSNGYRLGNSYQPSIWGARQLAPWLSFLGRLNGSVWENIRGADAMLNPRDEQTNDPNLQGGKRLDVAVGVDVHPISGVFQSSRFYVDVSAPVYQSLNGPQLQKRWGTRLGLQWEF